MKVSELISELQRLAKDDDPDVVVSVGSYYKVGSFTFSKISDLNRYTGHEIRLRISIGEEFVIRKKAKNGR